MKIKKIYNIVPMGIVLGLMGLSGIASLFSQQVAAACQALPSDKGVVTLSVNLPKTGSYRVWARILAPNNTSNSYLLQIDDNVCGVVGGDKQIAANTWTWVDYKDGNEASKIDVTLNKGAHTVKLAGRESDVRLDAIMLADDVSCVPSGTGTNCTGIATAAESNASTNVTESGTPAQNEAAASDDTFVVVGAEKGSAMAAESAATADKLQKKQKLVAAILSTAMGTALLAALGLYVALRHPSVVLPALSKLRARWETSRLFGLRRITHGNDLPTEVFGPDDKK